MHSSPPGGFVLPGRQERAPEGFMTPKSEVSEAPSQASHALDVKIHYRPGQHVVTSWHPQIHPQRSPTDIFMLVIGFWKILEAFFWLIHWRISWNGHHFGHPYPVAKVQKVWPVSLFTFEVWPATHGIQAMTVPISVTMSVFSQIPGAPNIVRKKNGPGQQGILCLGREKNGWEHQWHFFDLYISTYF